MNGMYLDLQVKFKWSIYHQMRAGTDSRLLSFVLHRDLAPDENRLKGANEKVGNSIIALSYEAKKHGVSRCDLAAAAAHDKDATITGAHSFMHSQHLLALMARRTMSGIAARALCPDLTLIQVPVAHGKVGLAIAAHLSA